MVYFQGCTYNMDRGTKVSTEQMMCQEIILLFLCNSRVSINNWQQSIAMTNKRKRFAGMQCPADRVELTRSPMKYLVKGAWGQQDTTIGTHCRQVYFYCRYGGCNCRDGQECINKLDIGFHAFCFIYSLL